MRARLLFAILVTLIGVPLFVASGRGGSSADLRPAARVAASPAAQPAAVSAGPTPGQRAAASAGPTPGPAAAASAGPTPAPTAAASTSGRPAAEPVVVPAGPGTFTSAPGGSARSGPGPLRRYTVRVEDGIGVDPVQFAAAVDATLADPRSWGAAGRLSFQRVTGGPAEISVTLASPATADRLCAPLDTDGRYSCGNGSSAVINAMRWLRGADAYAGRLADYRQYVINHEVGHTLGHGHEKCPGAGRPAPAMMQQTKGVGVCLAQPWPFG